MAKLTRKKLDEYYNDVMNSKLISQWLKDWMIDFRKFTKKCDKDLNKTKKEIDEIIKRNTKKT